MKVSVIVPAYNAGKYIEQCAYSLIYQTLDDIEIIFIDDGSTDNTGNILDAIKNSYPNTIVIHQENKGLYKAREIGLSFASGDYVGWVDADDYVDERMFEMMYEVAVQKDSELVICNYEWVPAKTNTKEKWFRPYSGIIDTSFVERNSQPWNKLVKKKLLDRLGIGLLFTTCFDEIYIHVLMEAKKPITIDNKLYYYRVGNESMSSKYKDVAHYRNFITASEELQRHMIPYVHDSYWNDYFEYRVEYYRLITMLVAANAGDRIAYEIEKRKLMANVPKYNKNQHFWKIIIKNYGLLRGLVIGGVVPMNYEIAKLACKVGLKTH